MKVLIEFLSEEPVDNFITAMNYNVDKLIYVCYKAQKKKLEDDLRAFAEDKNKGLGYRGEDIDFIEVEENNFPDMVQRIYDKTMDIDGDIFFDLTGGDHTILVAFGRVAEQIDAPLYRYDIRNDELVEIQCPEGRDSLFDFPKEDPLILDIEKYATMYGWKTHTNSDKAFKRVSTTEFLDDVETLWNLEKKYGKDWNCFLRGFSVENLQLETFLYTDINQTIYDDLVSNGFVIDSCTNGKRSFTYKNANIESCLKEDGSVLEIITCERMKDEGYDAVDGAHILWHGGNVLNEIDVVGIRDNMGTFVSCKAGNVFKPDIYEIDYLSRKLGGKYASKKLAVAIPPDAEAVRVANELGIEVWVVDVGIMEYEDEVDIDSATYDEV